MAAARQLPARAYFGILSGGRLRRKGMSSEESPAQPEFPVNAATPNGLRFAALYADLRQLAERQLRRSAGAPISPTTLLHEAYLDMSGKDAVFPDRERFIGYAARVMRGLIIDLVRERRALKRGAAFHITQLPTELGAPEGDEAALTRLSEALDELATHDARLAEVVDLKYFCGYTFEDIAAQRGTSKKTVQRDWEKARVILFRQLTDVS
jgi:RNA polymerase sigma factor (TIGR02999 family)